MQARDKMHAVQLHVDAVNTDNAFEAGLAATSNHLEQARQSPEIRSLAKKNQVYGKGGNKV